MQNRNNRHNGPQPMGVVALVFNQRRIVNWAIVAILSLLGVGLATQVFSLGAEAVEIPPAPAVSQGTGDNANSLIFSITDRTHSTFHVYDGAGTTFESCQKPAVPISGYYETLYIASPEVINAEDVKSNGAEPILEDARESYEYQVEKGDDSTNVCIRVTWGDNREDNSAGAYFYGPYSFETGNLVTTDDTSQEETPPETVAETPPEEPAPEPEPAPAPAPEPEAPSETDINENLGGGIGGQNREIIDQNQNNDQSEVTVVSAPITENDQVENERQIAGDDSIKEGEAIAQTGVLDDKNTTWSQTLGILILAVAILGALRIMLVKKLRKIH